MKGIISLLGGAAVWAAGHLGILSSVLHVSPTVQSVLGVAGAVVGVLGGRTAIAPQNAVVTANLLGILGSGWKTGLGAILAAVTFLLSPEVAATISPALAQVLTVISAILIALGVTHAGAANAIKETPA